MIKTTIHINQVVKTTVFVALLSISLVGNTQRDTILDNYNPALEAETHQIGYERFRTLNDGDQTRVLHREIDSIKAEQLKKEEDFWYVNETPSKKDTKRVTPKKAQFSTTNQTWLRNLLWVLVVGGFVFILIWFLIASDVNLFRKPFSVLPPMADDEELSTENIFDIDYNSALQKAVTERNYRLGIRMLYLQTLKILAMQKLIHYKQERTNNDYLRQMMRTPFYKDFFRLTRNFEYAWYGRFPVSPDAFEAIQQEFTSFKQRVV